MSEPHTVSSTPDSVARPHPDDSPWDEFEQTKRLLGLAGDLVSAAEELELALRDRDPAAALARLQSRVLTGQVAPWPMLRDCTMQHLQRTVVQDVEVDRDIAQCLIRQAGYAEDAFAASPGGWLPGASRSVVRTRPAGASGVIQYDHGLYPWRPCVPGSVQASLVLLAEAVEAGGYAGGILIGVPDTATEIALPEWVTHVVVQVTRHGGLPDGSELGPRGGPGGGRVA